MRKPVLLGGLLSALFAPVAFAQTPTTPPATPTTTTVNTPTVTEVPRVDADIVVDGKLDDAAWTRAATVDIAFETSPGDNLPASVKTTAYVAYTEDALLLGLRAEDPDPAKIRAFLRDRDALYDDDFLGVMLDTFDDGRRSYEFFVNPLGVQADLIREEATGNEDDSWDGLWTSAARITEAGYEVEMRIPFATLRFKDTDGTRRFAASFLRIRPREFRYQYFSNRIERGFVTYSDDAKVEMLGVPRLVISRCGAVSAKVAALMAAGALERSRADIAASVTGFAGPAGPGDEIGLVFVSVAARWTGL